MKDLKTLALAVSVGGVWLLIVTVFLLTVVTVEHYALTGWIFTLLMINALATFAGLLLLYVKIEALKSE